MDCRYCDTPIKPKRAELGYKTCISCGGRDAEKVRKSLSGCSAPAYNKGAYQPMMTRQDARDAGRK